VAGQRPGGEREGGDGATVETVAGRTYVFAARNPANPALMIFDITSLIP
jgi:hypothetical protein